MTQWKVVYSTNAEKKLSKLDRKIRDNIRKYVKNLSELPDPKIRGGALRGNLAGLWKYRVGDYRLICNLIDNIVTVLVIDIGHRREIYKK